MRVRHIPERTCIACRLTKPKRELTRVVHAGSGVVEVDPTGKKSGRGAYVCRQASCWELAIRKRTLDRALKTEISDGQRQRLVEAARLLVGTLAATGAEGEVHAI